MATRTHSRLLLNLFVFPQLIKRRLLGRHRPERIKRVLVIHHLLLGDTLMTAGLLAKLREQFPEASLVTAVPEAFTDLIAGNPWQVEVLPYSPWRPSTLWRLLRQPRFDLALVPGDNRYGWVAFAMGTRWICGFDGDRPAWKSKCFDELRPWPAQISAWSDMVSTLIDGPAPHPYTPGTWSPPPCPSDTANTSSPIVNDSGLPGSPHTLLHVGAKSPLKAWPARHWRALIQHLQARGHKIVLSCGPGEAAMLEELALPQSIPVYPGTLSLAQFWRLLAGANLLICPDNGTAHLARIIGTPTLCLFGPASSHIYGAGEYWSQCPYRAVSIDVPCRNQHNIFKREIEWAQTCERSPQQCPQHRCMPELLPDTVLHALEQLRTANTGTRP